MDALQGHWLNRWRKSLMATIQEYCKTILNKSWKQHPIKQQLYGHLPPITKTIKVRWTRHAGHCCRSGDVLISDVLLWTPSHGQARAGWLARTYLQQLCEDTGCSPEDLPEAMNNREEWWERVRDIRAGGTTWWWWWWCYFTASLVFSIVKEDFNQLLHLNISDWLVGWLVGCLVYGISTFVGYLTPNPFLCK